MRREAVKTTTALLESCERLGHETLWLILAREERLELPTLGFGDRCSTN